MTALNPKDEIRRQQSGGRPGHDIPLPWIELRPRHLPKMIKRRRRPPLLCNHTSAETARAYLDPEIWDNYLKISIERNPWDKAISLYWWARKGADDFPPLSDFLRDIARIKPDRLSNWGIYTLNEQVVADRVLRFEHLADDLDTLGTEIGTSDLGRALTRAKSDSRRDRRSYNEILNPEDAALISDLCRREIEYFGYEF